MSYQPPSALITEEGRRVLLRIRGRFYELTREELRLLLGVPPGPLDLGITVDGERLQFEFADHREIDSSAEQLRRRVAKRLASRGIDRHLLYEQ